MIRLSRRSFIHLPGATGTVSMLGALGCYLTTCSETTRGGARIVVVGGGFSGATCAKYLRRFDASLQVTLVKRDARYLTCPFSNTVLAGLQEEQIVKVPGSGGVSPMDVPDDYRTAEARYARGGYQSITQDAFG